MPNFDAMDDEWQDDFSSSAPADTFSDQGRSYGKGRGFKPRTDNDDSSVGNRNGGDNDWGSRSRGGGRGRGGGHYRDHNGGDENGSDNGDRGYGSRSFGGRGRGRGGGRGGGNRYGNDNDDDDNGDGDFQRGRGGGRGGGRGRGGNRDRDDFGGGGGGGGGDDGDKPEPINKEVYIPPEPSNEDSVLFGAGVDAGINFDKYDDIQINVTGENVPPMIQSFEEAGLRTLLEENIKKSGYTKPTPVQKHALPIILAGRDLMACAQTGSGKTAAFVVPIVNDLLNNPSELVLDSTHCEPQAVIVAPTRELATQIFDQARKFAKDSILKCVNIYGGTASFHQRQQVMRGAHILVATTGRLKDFVQRGHITFSSVRFFVLDEADRMLDLGFLPDIETIMDDATMVPTGDRQTLMFSATFPPEVQQLASKFLKDYIFIAVGIVGGACSDVEQCFFEVEKFKKREKLNEILQEASAKGPIERTLIFVETKRSADFLAAYLSENSYLTTSIHGDRLQRERECALNDFKSGRMPILVATAVAARGLDIKGVAHVINYDLPKDIDEFVHRIGRTGRVGNRGRATSFFNAESDAQLVPDLVRILKQAGQEVPAWLESSGHGGGGGYGGASRGSKFGGRDVRNFDNGGGDAYPESAYSAAGPEPEEQW